MALCLAVQAYFLGQAEHPHWINILAACGTLMTIVIVD